MVYLAIGTVIIAAIVMILYYRAEQNNMPRSTLKKNMIGIFVLIVILALLFKTFIIHDDAPAETHEDPAVESPQ
jgi:fluoride ion exporter CrcB/FEX